MSERPDAIVAVVLKEDRFLLIERGPGVPDAGYWAPLSGKVEDEDQVTAVVREVREEVGLLIDPLRKVWENTSASGTHRLHWWLARFRSGELTPNPREVGDTRWVTREEFLQLSHTFAGDRAFFESVYPSLAEANIKNAT